MQQTAQLAAYPLIDSEETLARGTKSKLARECSLYTTASMQHQRELVEQYIAARFAEVHGAAVTEFFPLLIELKQQQTAQAALGLRPGHFRPMFLEQYLNSPVEQSIAQLIHKPVDRLALVEVGNLVLSRKKAGLQLFGIMAQSLIDAGYEWMVFTITEEVEQLICALGFNPQFLAHARPDAVKKGGQDWGGYYTHKPRVMAGCLKQAADVIQHSSVLCSAVIDHKDSVNLIAQALADHRHSDFNSTDYSTDNSAFNSDLILSA